MKKLLLSVSILALAGAAAVAQDDAPKYRTVTHDELGEPYGVADNGHYVAIADDEDNVAWLWSWENPDLFINISEDPEPTSDYPSAMRIKGTSAYDVSDDGIVVGALRYADGHSCPAYYKDGVWTELELHPYSLSSNEARFISPDGKYIGGYSFIMDPTSDLGGKFYPCTWTLNDDGEYELEAHMVELPDHQGFIPLCMSHDGQIFGGTLFCAVGATIPALFVDGELQIFDELGVEEEPYMYYNGKWFCGWEVDENGEYILDEYGNKINIWTTDPDDPRILMYSAPTVNGLKDDGSGNISGAFYFCDKDKNFYGTRTRIISGALKNAAAFIFNFADESWTYNTTLSGYACGVGKDLMFANDGKVRINNKSNKQVTDYYGISTEELHDRPVAGINKCSMDGNVLGGISMWFNDAIGEYQYYPFVTYKEGSFSGIDAAEVAAPASNIAFFLSGSNIRVAGTDSMNVYTIDGRLVATGASVSLPSGSYVVKAGDKSAKFVVK